jgi:hypothetical protein
MAPKIRDEEPTMFMVIEGPADGHGRVPFTLFWSNPDGVDNPGPQQIPRRRAQCFRAVPREYLRHGHIKPVDSEETAKKLAWGSSK